jgi:hypothetical protein
MKLPLLLPILAVVALRCSLAPEGGFAQDYADKTQGAPLSITISTPTPVIKTGQGLWIVIQLTNLPDHSIDAPSAWMGGFDAVYNMEIRGPSGTQLTWTAPPDVAFLRSAPGTLDPGKTKNEQIPINEYYDLTQPGTYEIQVKRCIDLENPIGQAAPKYDISKGVIMSNKLTITVVPATPASQR